MRINRPLSPTLGPDESRKVFPLYLTEKGA